MGRPYKISEQDRIDICKKYQEGLSTSELSELYSIAVASINQMILKDDFFNELFYKKHDDKIHINTETITFKE